jgi:putative addiction module killer protein
MPMIYVTDRFDRWFRSLRDAKAKACIQARIDRIEDGHLGDHKSVGNKIYEARIHYGPGYRLYFALQGLDFVLLLVGGNKSTQLKDIEQAKIELGRLRDSI